MRTAVVFPGQGAQYVGMAASLVATEPLVAATLAEADEVLGLPLSRWIAEGPADRLAATEVTQPAVLAVSIAMWRLLGQRAPQVEPFAAAGHSLGEYAALVAAGSLTFPDALRLVRLRGQLMQGAVPRGEGCMLAVLGLDDAVVDGLCAQPDGPGVALAACYNGPGQVVISGARGAVLALGERARARGALSVVELDVSAPFHTPLLESAARGMAAALAEVVIAPPRFPIVQNVDGEPETEPAAIVAKLVRQIVEPVRWEACARRLIAMDAARVIEVGPGTTLTGLFRRIARRFPVLALDRPGAWESV
ncbi:MAG: ACP S-malonyltransferase [Pseudomonadota bacterium]